MKKKKKIQVKNPTVAFKSSKVFIFFLPPFKGEEITKKAKQIMLW